MTTLHVPLHPFGAKHTAIEGKFFPGLEANHLVPTHFQLNATLLATKAAMRFNQTLRRITRFVLPTAGRRVGWVGAEAVKQNIGRDRRLSHETPPLGGAAQEK